jgi:2-iminobutanoate/2-iminopropanoate deaminase
MLPRAFQARYSAPFALHSMPKQIITSPDAPTTGFTDKTIPSPLAQAIRAGNLLYVSGQGPLDPKTREVVSPDIREQTHQTLTNLKNILAAAGLTMASVVNMRVALRNTEDFPAFNEAFREFMAGEKVTRTCIGATPHRKGVNVEIDCVASFD